MKQIIGAGFSGLIAATQFRTADVFEISKRFQSHNALLRFKTDVISRITGIPFRKVRVQKNICIDGSVKESTDIFLCNLYSRKVTGKILNRSIADIRTVDRFVAPNDFYDKLIEVVGESRIHWEETTDFVGNDLQVLSTIPMNVIAKMTPLGRILRDQSFDYKNILVYVGTVKNSDVFQTMYFPGPETSIYRASITGDKIIIESLSDLKEEDLRYAMNSFGISIEDIEEGRLVKRPQRYGKISPIDERARRAFVLALTANHNIYSIGRFAVWKNILLDDLAGDIELVKKISANDEYRKLIEMSLNDDS